MEVLMIDEATIRCWWDTFKGDGALTEIRILGKGKTTYSGYFSDVESMISEIRRCETYGGIYATLNEIDPACSGREQSSKIVKSPKSTTSDPDIVSRRYVLIDFDPKRPSDTNATDGQVELANQRMKSVYRYLRDQGFSAPVVAASGNGYHLYYKVNLSNTPETRAIIERFLKALDMMFGDSLVDVDTSVFNAARIVKVIGTKSNKGTDTAERPQRMSKFVHIPEQINETTIEYFEKVASELPSPPAPTRENGYRTDKFDVDGFLSRNHIEISRRSYFNGGEKIILKECPFNCNHQDAAIFVLNNGGISFKCWHNSCQQYHWRDVLLHYEPDSFTRKDKEEYNRRRSYYGERQPKQIEVVDEDSRGKKWLSMSDVKWIDPSSYVSIPSGIILLDQKIMGFTLGDVTILSGLSGSGKTTLLDHFILNAAQRGYKVAAWSGELQDFRFQAWLDQMAAGKSHVVQKFGFNNLFYVPKATASVINGWLDGKFWLYNNDYGAGFGQLFSDIRECIEQNGVQLVLLDNLMAMDLDELDGGENERQTKLIKDLKGLAKKANVHIILVCHPRKEQSFQLLRKESIAGTANLTNLCDNLLISHRVGNDFEKRATDFFGADFINGLKDEDGKFKYQLVLEVAKNRSLGVVDQIIGLYYENETRRIKNEIAENIVYGWMEEPTQTTLDPYEDLPY